MHLLARAVRLGPATMVTALLLAGGLAGAAGSTALAPICVGAADQHHATLVVTHLSGQPPVRACVGFSEDRIWGSDLLDRSHVEWQSDAYQGQGTAVCQVDHEPQSPPQGSCLGHNTEPYWSIWTAAHGGNWTYAQRAITGLAIHDGDALGLRYQQPDGAGPPDAPGNVCPPPAPAAPAATSKMPPTAGPAPARSPATRTPGAGSNVASPSTGAEADPAPADHQPDSVPQAGPTPSASPAVTRIAPPARPAGSARGKSWVGPGSAVVAALVLVGALMAQVVGPRLRR